MKQDYLQILKKHEGMAFASNIDILRIKKDESYRKVIILDMKSEFTNTKQ